MNFQELGLVLQQEREKKGLSVEVVMEATKISRINLIALEKGDRSSLPHPVYTKGFVKSYARFLGLDADELSMIVDREYQDEEQNLSEVSYDVSPMAEKAFQEAVEPATQKKSVMPLILGMVVLIAIVAFSVVSFLDGEKKQPVEAPVSADIVETPAQTDSAITSPEVESSVSVIPSESGDVQGSESDQQAVVSKEQAPVVEPQKIEKKPVEKIEKKVVEAPAPKPVKQKYDHVLIIRATTNKGCWIGVWKGNAADMSRDFVLKKGEPLRLMFNHPRRIRIGNAAGVSVLYNGKPYPLDKAKGNIQTIRFGME